MTARCCGHCLASTRSPLGKRPFPASGSGPGVPKYILRCRTQASAYRRVRKAALEAGAVVAGDLVYDTPNGSTDTDIGVLEYLESQCLVIRCGKFEDHQRWQLTHRALECLTSTLTLREPKQLLEVGVGFQRV
eukprot:9772851-Alexandrium_andersonii.AAC.2